MPKQLKGTEFDSFFVNKTSEIKDKVEEKIEKETNSELQNSDITKSHNSEKTELQKIKKSKKQKLAKRDDPNYQRVTVSILRKKLKKIKDYMWENQIKNFDDALELFLSDKPLN